MTLTELKVGTKYCVFVKIYFCHCMTSSLKFEITAYFSGFVCQFIQGH